MTHLGDETTYLAHADTLQAQAYAEMCAPEVQPVIAPLCRSDGRCQYAIDHGAEGLGHCPVGKCCMPAQPVTKPYGWIVTGSSRLFTGEYAEYDAKNEAAHCGGTAKAVALFDAPQPVIAPPHSITGS